MEGEEDWELREAVVAGRNRRPKRPDGSRFDFPTRLAMGERIFFFLIMREEETEKEKEKKMSVAI
jgi:hypothetical protein